MEDLKAKYAVIPLQYELTPLKWLKWIQNRGTTSATDTTVNIWKIENN